MDYELSDAHKLIQDTARRIAKEKIAPRAAEMDETGEYPHDIFEAFEEAGLTGLTIPSSTAAPAPACCRSRSRSKRSAKYCCASGLMLLLSALPSQPVMIGGDEEQKKWIGEGHRQRRDQGRLLPDGAQPRLRRRRTSRSRAVSDGDDYIINGEKMYISGGTVADYVVLRAHERRRPARRASAASSCRRTRPASASPRSDRKMGVRGVPTADIVLRGLPRAAREPGRRRRGPRLQPRDADAELVPARRRRARPRAGGGLR